MKAMVTRILFVVWLLGLEHSTVTLAASQHSGPLPLRAAIAVNNHNWAVGH